MPRQRKTPEKAPEVTEEPLEVSEEDIVEAEEEQLEPQPGDSDVSMNEGSIAAGGPDEPVAPELALAIREERGVAEAPMSSLPSAREWAATIAVAREIAATPFVPESYRGRPEAVVAAILTGREIGIGPMQSLRDIHMIDGRPAFAADLMLAQMRKGGVVILESEVTMEHAWIRARRNDTGEIATVEWTYAEAEQIMRRGKRLVDGDNWKNYRPDMLWARCVGRLARRFGSDLLGGLVYSKEELGDLGPDEDYSASTKPEPVTWETLKPGEQLWWNAPKGWAQILVVLEGIDSSVDWPAVVSLVLDASYGVTRVADLGDNAQVAGRRLANMSAYLADVVLEGKDFPPPTDDEIRVAIAWAFEGLAVEIPDRIERTSDEEQKQEEEDPAGDAALSPEQQEAFTAAVEKDEIEFGEQTTTVEETN